MSDDEYEDQLQLFLDPDEDEMVPVGVHRDRFAHRGYEIVIVTGDRL